MNTPPKVQYNKLSYLKKIVKYLFLLFIFLLPFQTRYIYQLATLNPSLPSPQMGGNIAWEYGTLSLYATEILLGIIIILYVIGFITAYSRTYHNMSLQKLSQNAKKNLKNPLIFLPLALLLWSVASIFWSYDKIIAWNRCIILMEGIIVYLLFLNSRFEIQNSKQIQNPNVQDHKKNSIANTAFIPLVAGAILQSILAIYQFITQQIIANKWLGIASHIPETLGTSVVETPLRRWLRAYGSLPHPNILAAYLGITLLLMLIISPFLKGDKGGFKKSSNENQQRELTNAEDLKQRGLGILKVFAIFIISIAIVFTFSRAVWIGLFLAIIIFLILTKLTRNSDKNKTQRHPDPALAGEGSHRLHAKQCSSLAPQDSSSRKAELRMTQNFPLIPSFGFFILFLFALFLVREPILARISNANRLEQKSNQERMLSYKEGANIIKEKWLLGTGIGNYTLALYKKNPGLSAYDYQPVHNLFMLILAELGIFGLFIFLLFLFYVAKKRITSFKLELTTDSPSSQDLTTGNPIAEKNYFILPSRQSLPVCAGRSEGTLTIKEKNYFIILFIFILLISLFDHYFWSLYFGVILFWISMGIMIS